MFSPILIYFCYPQHQTYGRSKQTYHLHYLWTKDGKDPFSKGGKRCQWFQPEEQPSYGKSREAKEYLADRPKQNVQTQQFSGGHKPSTSVRQQIGGHQGHLPETNAPSRPRVNYVSPEVVQKFTPQIEQGKYPKAQRSRHVAPTTVPKFPKDEFTVDERTQAKLNDGYLFIGQTKSGGQVHNILLPPPSHYRNDAKYFLDTHNNYRDSLQNGQVPNQPRSINIHHLVS
ncbi:hypothetical protein D915_001807 [Fasciola hepatica]|uniref:Uncharacterized protein n=1 Tax=Fasciola hepatica TaxID=6192 RepID=A0A4E0S3F9_FASHE|nr:hypothetical protein D915_001807 [Fasciola hepatica]